MREFANSAQKLNLFEDFVEKAFVNKKLQTFGFSTLPTGPKIVEPKNDNLLRKMGLFGNRAKNSYKFDAKKYISTKLLLSFFFVDLSF